MADDAKYRVGMVSKMTGLSTHTLRRWEKRYAAVVPKRTEAGGRLYTDADVERLRLLYRLVERGHSIGGIAKLPDVDLRRMSAEFPATSSQPVVRHLPDLRARVMAAIEGFKTQEAEELLSRAALSTEPREFLTIVVGPLLVEVGNRWERGELRIAHEHACSTVMRGLLFSLMRLYPANGSRRRVVVTTPSNEAHELGALMVAMLAAMHGWSVLYLGPDLPAEEIAYAVSDTNADLLMLSITNLRPTETEQELAAVERAIPESVEVLIGGRAAKAPAGSRVRIEHDLAALESILSR